MSIKKKFIGADQIDGSKIKLLNNQALKGLDASSGDVSILKIDASGKVQLLSLPQVASDPSAGNDISRKSYVDSAASSAASAAAAAVVEDAIVNGVTAKAPSQNAVFDALALKQNSFGTGSANQFLKGDLTWGIPSKGARVFTVGIDANTIADCIALCSSPSASNGYVIEIPPGTYTENLTIPGNVHLKGLTNPGENLSVKIVGQHTITGASANALNNRVSVSNALFTSSHATTANFTISGSAATEVQMVGCYIESTASASTAKLFSLGANSRFYINNCRTYMPSGGSGGTHFVVSGGTLYSNYGLISDGGTCVLDMTVAGYAQLQYAQLACQGASAMKIVANGLVILANSSLSNAASNGHGVNMLGASASIFATHSVFNIQENAASYVVTGVVGSVYGFFANNYSNIAGATRNIKIGPNVTQLRYSGSLASADINDFTAAARSAAVADAIVDGVTNVAPSQNAVFDALALKISSSEKGSALGVASLGADGKIPSSQLPAIAITDTFVVASQAAMLALDAQVGDLAIRTDVSKSFILTASPASTLANWQEILSAGAVLSVNGQTGVVSLSKSDVGLGNVDNTSDANKPVSTATQSALNLKYDASNPSGYVTAAGAAAAAAAQQKYQKITLSAGDISNGYIDLSASVIGTPLVINGPSRIPLLPADDFTVSGARITWNVATVGPGGEEALVEGETIHVFYMA